MFKVNQKDCSQPAKAWKRKFPSTLAASILCLSAIPALASYETQYRYSSNGLKLAELSADSGNETEGLSGRRYAKRFLYEDANRPSLITSIEVGVIDESDIDLDPLEWGSFEVDHIEKTVYNHYGQKLFSGSLDSNGKYHSLRQLRYDDQNRVLCSTVRMNNNGLSPDSSPADACELGAQGTFGKDRITQYKYDKLDNVIKVTKAFQTDLQQDYATYKYTGARKDSVTDANGNYTKYTYDEWDRLEYVYYPSKDKVGSHDETDYERYGYDLNGNRILWRKRRGDEYTFLFEYDAQNRMVQKNVPYTTIYDVIYGYELNGANTSVMFTNGEGIANNFNGFGQMLTSKTSLNDSDREVSYQYDSNGNKSSTSFQNGNTNQTVQYAYDFNDRINKIGLNGSTLVWVEYNQFGMPESFQRSSTKGAASTIFTYDGVSRLSKKDENFTGSTDDFYNQYTYSPASQIASHFYSNNQFQYIGGEYRTGEYKVNGKNQYENVDGQIVNYDKNGNLSRDGSKHYEFDNENRLITVTDTASDLNVELTYDPMGRLFDVFNKKTGKYQQFLYDGDALLAEYSSGQAANVTAYYVHGVGTDIPLVQFEQSNGFKAEYLHSNHQGSILAASDSSGRLVSTNSYDTFGIPGLENQGRFGYTGQMWMPELGLYHYKARMYEPRLGRFLQTDPVGYEDQMNLYAYVHNDPVNMVDPTGMQSDLPYPLPPNLGEIYARQPSGSSCGCQQLTGENARAFVRGIQNATSYVALNAGDPLVMIVRALGSVFNENGENTSDAESTPDSEGWEKIPGKAGAYRPKGKKEPIFEKDRAGGRSHGGSKWKKWNKKRDWEKGKNRDGTYNEEGVRLRD